MRYPCENTYKKQIQKYQRHTVRKLDLLYLFFYITQNT